MRLTELFVDAMLVIVFVAVGMYLYFRWER